MMLVDLAMDGVLALWSDQMKPLVTEVVRATQRLPNLHSTYTTATQHGLSREEVLRLVPSAAIVAAVVVTAVATVVTMLRGHRSSQRHRPRTYWLTRLALTRVMGVVYVAAFSTACHQMRPMYGEHGEPTPLQRPHNTPFPLHCPQQSFASCTAHAPRALATKRMWDAASCI
jgi:hypothetical protein